MLGWRRSPAAAAPLREVLDAAAARALREALGLESVGDLLTLVPPRWLGHDDGLDVGPADEGRTVTAMVTVTRLGRDPAEGDPGYYRRRGRRPRPREVHITDGSRQVVMPVFGQAALLRRLRPGSRLLVLGQVRATAAGMQLANADFLIFGPGGEPRAATGRLEKLLAAAEDVGELRRLLARPALPLHRGRRGLPGIAVALYLDRVLRALPEQPEPLPEPPPGLPGFDAALRGLQFPPAGGPGPALARLKYDEALELQLALALRRRAAARRTAPACPPRPGGVRERLTAALPFELTGGQAAVLAEIDADLDATAPMNRLLQGEVGSGKTAVAALAMARVVDASRQCALLAPTEVLAAQHARTLAGLFGELPDGPRVLTLTGSMAVPERRAALLAIVTGEVDVVVGTHALISEGVEFFDLGLVVVDEQHRFGVRQRDRLRDRGREGLTPHVLVMTATPIPRSIAMTVFGDLAVSTLAELPGGRAGVDTAVVPVLEKPRWAERAWARIREEVAGGARAFVVCPRIDAADPGAGAAAGDESLESVLPLVREKLAGLRIGVLHGRLPAAEKEARMAGFAAGEVDVLVCTSIVEVGVDVPEATVMMIRGAESFGVSQLHQLRGRVGRGSAPGLCLLCTRTDPGTPERERLEGIAATVDGFRLAELDLRQRRHGDVLGEEQSGAGGGLGVLDLIADARLIRRARVDAERIAATDPGLARRLTADITAEESDYLERG